MTTAAHHVFVSYKREDKSRVLMLVECLRHAGLSVWWDADIPGGAAWRAEILKHFNQAKCVIVVWSEKSVSDEGEFVQEEADRARRRGFLLPVVIDAVSPPLGFGQLQALDLVDWTGDETDPRFANVVAAARARIADGPLPTPALPSRRAWGLAATAAFALSVVGFLSDIASLQSVVCTVPGVRALCGSIGLGGVPTSAETDVWKSRPVGDCAWLRAFVGSHRKSVYTDEAIRLLETRRTVVDEVWQREERRQPIHVSPALRRSATAQSARDDAVSRGISQADLACSGFAFGAYRLHSRRVAKESIQWSCDTTFEGVRCGFDAQAICEVDARHSLSREVCGT